MSYKNNKTSTNSNQKEDNMSYKNNKTSTNSNQNEGCMSYKNNLKHNKTSAKEYNTPSSANQEVNLFKDFDQNSQDLNSFSLSDIVSKNIKSSQFLDSKEQSVIEDCYKQDHNVSEQKEADLSKASELNTQSTDYEEYMPKNNNDLIKELNPDFIAEVDKRVCEQMEKEKDIDLKPNESTISMLSELGIQEKPEEDPHKEMRTEEHPPLRTEAHSTEQYISNNTYNSIYKDVDNFEKYNSSEEIPQSSIEEIANRAINGIENKREKEIDPLRDLLTGELPPLGTEEHPTEQYISNNTYKSTYKHVDNLAKGSLDEIKNSITKKTNIKTEEPLPEKKIEVDESNLSNYRYTYIPSKAIIDPNLTHAEFRLFSILCSYISPKTDMCFPKKEYLTEEMGVSIASVNKHIKSLQNKGYILEYKSRLSIYRLNFEALDGQKYTATPVPAKAIFDLNLTHAKYRCLAVLCSYADYKTATCYPSNKTIAENLYVNKRQVSKYITTLNRLRYLRITRRFNKVKGYQNSNLYQVIFDKFRIIDPHKEMRIEEHPPLRTEEHPTEQYISNNTYNSIYKDVDNSEQENLNESSDNNLSNREFNNERLAGGEVHSINKSNRDNKKGQTKFITEYMYLPTSRRKHKLTHVTNPYKKGYLGEGYLSYTENMDRRMWQEINNMAGRNFCYNSTNRIIKGVIAQKIKNNKPLPIFNDLLSLKKYLAAILKGEKRQEQAVNDNLHWAPTSLIKFWEKEQII